MTGLHLRRLVWFSMIVSILLGVLSLRLAYIQLVATESFSPRQINLLKQSVNQRQEELILKSGRGAITDRHGQVLTGQTKHVLVIFPLSQRTVQDEKLNQVAERLDISVQDLRSAQEQLSEPSIFKDGKGIHFITKDEADRINELNIPGLLGLPYELRYSYEDRLASHLLGYLGQNPDWIMQHYPQEVAQGILDENSVIGISGLERTFQPFLQGLGPTSLAYYVDGRGEPLQGLGLKYIADDNPFYPLTVQTTLDANLQKSVEHIMADHSVQDGAVVILDSQTSEIMAMASSPSPVEEDFSHPSWNNKALKRYTPGSVFKVVVAAAALEKELTTLDTTYECPGSIPGTSFKCWKEGGHGKITFAQAFYESCNIVFGELAAQLGDELLEQYADKLGLLQLNGWHKDAFFHLTDFKQLDREEQGQVFDSKRTQVERSDIQYLRQTGIGQLDVQLTPLAVANMMAAISRGGSKYQVKAVNAIEYQMGGTFYLFPDEPMAGESITPYTAYQLQQLLRGVVTDGTAQGLKDAPQTIAGKTGTAQVSKERELEHRWFAGYFPAEKPRYALAVLIINQKPGQPNLAIEVANDLITALSEQEN
jgi:cell division protein FtsI/penicillin-binding protein 2